MATAMAGCFWVSSPPDFKKDRLTKVTVIWDMPVASNMIEQTCWVTTNTTQLSSLSDKLNTRSWQSVSLLLVSHPTRIIVSTHNGGEWEIHFTGFGRPEKLSMYDRHDPGRSGVIKRWEDFTIELTRMIETDIGAKVDLTTDYTSQLYARKVERTIPEATRLVVKQLPKP